MLSLPHDAKGSLPNCGLTAMAVASGKSLKEATDAYQKAFQDFMGRTKRGNWKGSTNVKVRRKAMLDYMDMELEDVEFKRGNLRSLLPQLEKNCKYIVTTTGHVQVVENDLVIDQRGLSNIADYWGSGKQVKSVLKVISNSEQPTMSIEDRKREIEERKQLEMCQSVLTSMNIAINEDDCYSHRERTLKELFEEMKEYFGETI